MTQTERRTTTSDNPYIMQNPSLAFVNLAGDAGKSLMAHDHVALQDIFPSNVHIAGQTLPKCNVLFLYCGLEASGRISGASFTFRDLIRQAGAHIAVIASEINPALLSAPEFTKSLSAKHDWPANIVIALNRNGQHFGRFFQQLFLLMRAGISMPMAWVRLAPQSPRQPPDIPGTICLMEAGHIAFAAKKG